MAINTSLQRKWLRGSVLLCLTLAIVGAAGCDRGPSPEASDRGQQQTDPAVVEQQLIGFEHRFAQLYDGEADADRLIADMEAFVQTHPDNYEARRLYAQTLQLAMQPEAAYEQYEAVVEMTPDDAELRLMVGDLAMQLRQYEDAQRHYSRGREFEPRRSRFRVRLAQSLIEQQRYDDARRELLEAVRLDSSDPATYIAFADLYARQNRVDQALAQVDRALDLLPASDEGRRLVYVRRQAALLRRANQPDQALAVLRDLPASQQLRIDVAQDMASCWVMLGQPERAASHFDEILRFDPSDDIAAAAAAHWHLRAGQFDEAHRRVEQLRRINPRSSALEALERTLAEIADDETDISQF